MIGTTHIAVGVALTTAVFGFDAPALATTVIASTVPDLDRHLPGMHRQVTHSLLALIVVYLFGSQYFPGLVYPFLIGYSGHLLMDILTPAGVPLLWPVGKRFRLPITSTGSFIDRVVIRYAAITAALVFIVMG